MEEYVFTFGSNHVAGSKEGYFSLGNRFVRIPAPTHSDARDIMFNNRGNKWSMQYRAELFEPQINLYGLSEIALEDVWLDEKERTGEM